MAWTIAAWSPAEGTGLIASPHYGPLPFDASANVDGVTDYRDGEEVWVELEGDPPKFRVAVIRPMHQRQPEGTHSPIFDAVNPCSVEVLEEQPEHALALWWGDCCARCSPDPSLLRFEGVTTIKGLTEPEINNLHFRLASPTEIADQQLTIPGGATAFCIVTNHGHGRDGPSIFVVARNFVIKAATWASRDPDSPRP